MLWSRTGTRVRRGLKDVLRSGVAGTRGKGWIIARAIALCGAVSGLVIIDAAGASLSLFRLDPSAAAAQGSPLGEETWSQEVGGGALSVNSAERTYAANGRLPVRAAAKPPITTIAGDASWDSTPATSGFEAGASYTVCFVPGEDCEGVIVAEINQARSVILVQAYSFTSMPIAKALVSAKQRGVSVQVILDKSQRSERYSGATFLANAGIRTLIDEQPSIAHSKVIIIDGTSVITGSFNFTRSAQQYNAENLIVIRDGVLAQHYTQNWVTRERLSSVY
jgi:phosphatidylserine/phosphatidylglycerophosphate/cardiolipin synthase-like enzyme